MKKMITLIVLVAATIQLVGCAAIEHRNLKVEAKMSNTIFLDAETLAERKPVFVRTTNTSDVQDIDFNTMLKSKLASKGYSVTTNPKEAGYLIQANVLYMGQQKDSYTYAGALAGGYGGTVGGVMLASGSGLGGKMLAGGAGALIAGAAGAVVGSLVHVDSWMGVCDVQIKEAAAPGSVVGKVKSRIEQGSGTTVETEQAVRTDKQEYRTRIAVQAVQTNINANEASSTIAERLASQIAGMF